MKSKKGKLRLFTRTTAIILSAILVLSLTGISYAYWKDSLKINCTISTGSWQEEEESAEELEAMDKTTKDIKKIGTEAKTEEVQIDKEEGIEESAEELEQDPVENTAGQDQEVEDEVEDLGEQKAEEDDDKEDHQEGSTEEDSLVEGEEEIVEEVDSK